MLSFSHPAKFSVSVTLVFGLIIAGSAGTAEAGKDLRNSSAEVDAPEMKKNMADMYQKMADCLKTEKSAHDCETAVMKDCPVMKETGHCTMMEGLNEHDSSMAKKGMKHGKMKGMHGMKSMDGMQGMEGMKDKGGMETGEPESK